MNELITSRKEWIEEYKKSKYDIWTIVKTNNTEYFFKNYTDWYKIKDALTHNKEYVLEVSLQYRSHIVSKEVKDCDGIYIIRSITGKVGGESINTMTIGLVKGNEVHKTSWSLPDLSERDKSVDDIQDCFKEALLLWDL